MADNKEYISHGEDLGSISISEEVLAVIAGAAALDVEGVGALGSTLTGDAAAVVNNRKSLAKGIRLAVEGENVAIDVTILVRYGYGVTDVAKAVQESVFSAVESTSGLKVTAVNVTVSGVTFQK